MPPRLKPVQTALALYELWLGAALLTRLRHDSFYYTNAMVTSRQLLHLDCLDAAQPPQHRALNKIPSGLR